jgi:hypothetical protein
MRRQDLRDALMRGTILLAALVGAGCGGQAMPTAPALVFTGAPALTTASASGQLSLQIWWSPTSPTVGYDAAQLAISDTTGAPVSGLTLTIVPWMTAHGHGASVDPTVTEASPGVYVATPIDFFMSGSWELMTAIAYPVGPADAANAGVVANDSADPMVNVP